jgi:hypothetical protein
MGRCQDGYWVPPMLRTLLLLLAVTAVVMAVVGLDRRTDIGADDAEAAALDWVGVGVAQEPRRDGGEWEVDIVRPDGSMVEVTIGDALEVRGFDEERGAAGRPAHDEVHGPLRAAAIDAALTVTGSGEARSVERDGPGEVEVGLVTRDDLHVEVELDASLHVTEVELEDPQDE